MFNFFFKKKYIKDLLDGFVDIHNHILPGIDDGAKNTRESLYLINRMIDLGVSQFIPTPHIMQGSYPNNYDSIGNSYQNLLKALDSETKSKIKINPAAEYMLDTNFETLLEAQNLYPLKGSYILIEMSYFQAPLNLENIILKIKRKGYLPILAHPERYAFYHKNLGQYKKLKQLGCFFQLNLLSLSNYYGKKVEKTAIYLMEENLIDFTGSDIHHKNHIDTLSNLTLSNKEYTNISEIILNTNSTFSVT